MKGNPTYLYHYTNVTALALILKTHKFRFNSLDKMDDLQEQMSADLQNAGKFMFISSWTDLKEESIPMWKIYSSLEAGIRIKLKSNPFEKHPPTPDEMNMVTKITKIDDKPYYISVKEMAEYKFYSRRTTNGGMLCKVKYTDDEILLKPTIKGMIDGKKKIFIDRLGIYKNTFWKFQKEWRYIFDVIPFKSMPVSIKELNEVCESILADGAIQPFSHFDIKISDEAFSKMEITLSPGIHPGNKIIVEDLVNKYNPTATIKESALRNLVR